MKISNRSKFHKGGYAALLSTVSLAITIMAFALTSFRETRQSHVVQVRNQVKLDYSQKEKAFLRALLNIVPNTAMEAMMKDSWDDRVALRWPTIFEEALLQASIEQSLDPAMASTLGISVNAISSNTGDSNVIPNNFIVSPNGNGNMVMQDSNGNRPANLDLPPRLRYYDAGWKRNAVTPILNFNKRLSDASPLYTEMPYPEIAFGYAQQGADFIAKRNWWAFTVNFGAESAAVTGIAPTPRTYVLSIYEVPTQLAISSSGSTTSLGKFDGGTSWDPANISILGKIYADKARIEDLSSVSSVASRKGVTWNTSSTLPDEDLGDLEQRRSFRALTNAFHPFSSSSDSGLVSFTPINRGIDFFDYFADTTLAERTTSHFTAVNATTPHRDYLSENTNLRTVNELNWSQYSLGARQTQMQVEVGRTLSSTNQLPDRLFITARFDGDTESGRQRTTRTQSWKAPGEPGETNSGVIWDTTPHGDDWFIQSDTLPNGRPCLLLDLEKLPAFLTEIGADDCTVNNSIWIGPNYGSNNVAKPNYPSTDEDMALRIIKSTDLSAYTNGLTIITPLRVYFTDNFNDVPVVPAPAGVTLDANGDWYPPVSVYAPEKRFGTQNTSGNIEISGQVGYLPNDNNTDTVNPLDLKDGGTDTVTPSTIKAELKGITQVEDLPPVSAMNWLTVIEEMR